MDTTMELDELRQAWHTLGRQLERQHALQWELLREQRLSRVRIQLRPLLWGQGLQFLLGVGLIMLGVACWTRNMDIPGLLAGGVMVHAFGVLTAVMAALTITLAAGIDYSAPVLRIQKRMAQLLRLQACNSSLCGLPWWIMWLPVVVAFAGLGDVDPARGTPGWIATSLGIGMAGLIGTWIWTAVAGRRASAKDPEDGRCTAGDGTGGIRRGQRLLDELARFERE
jgi:hypothetical protein